MKLKPLFLGIAIFLVSLNTIRAQEIPSEILGIWSIYQEMNVCQTIISDSDVLELSIIDKGNDMTLDTVHLILMKNNGISDTCLAMLEINSSSPEWITVNPLVGGIAPGWQNFEITNSDSLAFTWVEACNACSCGGTYSMIRSALVNTENVVHEKLVDWKVYPNPAIEEIYISTESGDWINKGEIVLLDLRGRVIKKSVIETNPSVLRIDELIKGMYYLLIRENGTLTIKKILKI